MTNLARHLLSHDPRRGALQYRFPNGQEVSVIPDPAVPLRWELLSDSGTAESSLTSEQAEARLREIAARPMPEWDGRS
ncbi:hypothetical protein ACFFX1_55470 [Dactylosporangium sucinum]|uniref:Uncharacterized protein n=1 Tax=Dactylosporangium sucinum TaxID=1424081 RepID=A0A917X1L1_9ACTN|nr:hypothetical protein [Dactylosporangium sucinum]GGM52599.1 hypothetical protein GCM10007977_062700 [Dactylosporangium sucinum]